MLNKNVEIHTAGEKPYDHDKTEQNAGKPAFFVS